MGKKDGNRKRKAEDVQSEDEGVDAELQQEIAALLAARNEKKQASGADGEAPVEKVVMYNKEGLLKCIEELDQGLPFAETMMVTEFAASILNENDDIEREMAFYNQTLSAVVAGRAKMQAAGLPVRRPNDYFCENVKTDAHMTKIKDRLLIEDKRIEAFELRKNKDNNRKFNKQVKELRKAEGAAQRKQQIADVSNIRKEPAEGGESREDKVKKLIEAPVKSKKRQNMDKKYGFGGADRKKAKLNDKKSLNDMKDFNPRGGKFVRREGGGRGGGGGGRGGAERGGAGRGAGGRSGSGGRGGGKSQNRPGKEARTQRRAGRASTA
mmetsp:Transcript_18195/g.36646  ORF Transcript_18195/g.36646 Transcript_18195/m.36646 type:complete len:324 (+) Transcript_18195:114-1085(+)